MLLFFDHNDFSQEPLERFAATFQVRVETETL